MTEQELADLESNPKAKETTKQRKRDMVDKLKRDLQQAKDDRAALDLGGSSGGFGGGNNPYAKIMEESPRSCRTSAASLTSESAGSRNLFAPRIL